MMSFTQDYILSVEPPEVTPGGVLLQWTSSAPSGTIYQVYVGQRLAWHGTTLHAIIPTPLGKSRVDIGSVDAGEGQADFSGSLPGAYLDRVELKWPGGTYLDPTGNDDVSGFHVYSGTEPGGKVDYSNVLADIPAYDHGIITDGWGEGGWGEGGWGRASSSHSWTSGPLVRGIWNFGVRAYDFAGNEATPFETTVAIITPPTPPARFADGLRVHHTYSQVTRRITLAWQPSA